MMDNNDIERRIARQETLTRARHVIPLFSRAHDRRSPGGAAEGRWPRPAATTRTAPRWRSRRS
jgi:hypothetical protein